ncbi:polyamine aminopropyltransferase [Paraburkholderia nemoris]|uniref:Polyamine aminopropyltransferase n=1 Tax=Paraburkholderia nemoris TaxID=2793076 RepID=A0ABM8RNP9_9BURK|nr:polyamine aminopropyltransferase [Paraburkholderia nemoris]KPD19611.1 spermidine synthase [Burkholderia sp. ST111]MBK3738438.1 polyamine aminopropyltransferase [Paraburkholderia aspalathi]MBK5153107.1 polyamine aminopropyltransferase [Burkholderia sp. R-69608]MBK3811567.1 polyamine aminopropyltransferase [Paraburkholderia aspalathi]CAE6730606.1 Polyamine aminopropyltransferase [Paraburkholderia nemoris]
MSAPLLFHPTADAVYGFPDARRLARVDSPYQRIEVWDTPQLGRLFTLDGRPMTSTGDEFIYHECMVHPAALAHPSPKAALVLGGGDGGAAQQLLKHPGIERIVVAELDAQVVRLTREYLPEVHGGAFDDPRVELVIGDAADFVAGALQTVPATEQFDLVVFDLTPPDSPASGLYTPDFYTQLKRVMSPTAALSLHLGSPYFHAERIAGLLNDLRDTFAIVRTMSTFIPLYGSLWMMATASDTLDPASLTVEALTERLAARRIDSLKHYDPTLHAGLFSASRSVRDKLSQFLKPSS